MELNDSFEVAHGIDAVWDVLTDVERLGGGCCAWSSTGTRL